MSMRPQSARPITPRSPRGTPQGYATPRPPSSGYSSPRNFRPGSAPVSGGVRGGGRLFVESPLQGYSEQEMIQEARIRLAHNKQRQRLKQLLSTAADGGPLVATKDLLLACKLAKMDSPRAFDAPFVPESSVRDSFVAARDCYGRPQKVAWKGFANSLDYPTLHGAGQFRGQTLPPTRTQRKAMEEREELIRQAQAEAAAQAGAVIDDKPKASDAEVQHHFKILKRLMETRFAELRRAFRLIDEDNSGFADRQEMKHMLNAMFNLNIPEHVLDRLIDLADYDGDGVINFAEFARIATTDNVLDMKKTLQADTSGWGTVDPDDPKLQIDYTALAEQNRKAARGGYDGGYHPKLRRTGPGLDQLRRAHKTFKGLLSKRYRKMEDAFDEIDVDRSGTLRRAELRRFLQRLSKTIPDRVITGLIDFCDDDGDGKTLSKGEFVKLMSAEFLGAGGLDPNSIAMRGSPRR